MANFVVLSYFVTISIFLLFLRSCYAEQYVPALNFVNNNDKDILQEGVPMQSDASEIFHANSEWQEIAPGTRSRKNTLKFKKGTINKSIISFSVQLPFQLELPIYVFLLS